MSKHLFVFFSLSILQQSAFGDLFSIQSQEWSYAYDYESGISNYVEQSSQRDDLITGAEPAAMAHNWFYSGDYSQFAVFEGLSWMSYQSNFTDSLQSELESHGDFESMLSIDYQSNWLVQQFSSGSEGQLAATNRIDGRVFFEIAELADAILRVKINRTSFAIGLSSDVLVRVSIVIESDSGSSYHFESYLPFGEFAESVVIREFLFEPGQYVANITCELAFDSGGEGLMEHTGNCDVSATLFGRSRSAPELPIGLNLSTDESDSLVFSVDNLEIGKEYRLQASPDLDFSAPQTIRVFSRETLFPTEKVRIGSMGPKHFFRLVSVD